MRKWIFLAGAAAATMVATVVVSLAIRRTRTARELEEIPELIADCFDRIHRIEEELQQLRRSPEPA